MPFPALLVSKDESRERAALRPLLEFPREFPIGAPPLRVRHAVTIDQRSWKLDPLFLSRSATEPLEVVIVLAASLHGMHMRRELNV
jgi:hypothetical protein